MTTLRTLRFEQAFESEVEDTRQLLKTRGSHTDFPFSPVSGLEFELIFRNESDEGNTFLVCIKNCGHTSVKIQIIGIEGQDDVGYYKRDFELAANGGEAYFKDLVFDGHDEFDVFRNVLGFFTSFQCSMMLQIPTGNHN